MKSKDPLGNKSISSSQRAIKTLSILLAAISVVSTLSGGYKLAMNGNTRDGEQGVIRRVHNIRLKNPNLIIGAKR